MAGSDQGEKTEEPTPEKRRKAKEEGNVARSKDAGSIAASAAVLLLVGSLGPASYLNFRTYLRYCFRSVSSADIGTLSQVGRATQEAIFYITVPLAFAAAIGGIMMSALEVGLQLNLKLLQPKWSRLDPSSKIKKLFSPKNAAVMSLLTLGRVFVVAGVATYVIKGDFDKLSRLPRVALEPAIVVVLGLLSRIAIWSTLALAIMTAIDYGQAWWRREKELKMTIQEVKDEMHQQEGDPKMKGRRLQRAREIARSGLLKEIQGADVVVANPTHVAVVIRYRPEEGAPVVAAKGLDEMAQMIKEIARKHDIPVVESKELARSLHAQVKVGRRIPAELFKAVAELLAYVYRLKRKKLRA